MQLPSNNEIVGVLQAINEEDQSIQLIFSCDKEIELPGTAIPLNVLKSFIGKRIGILKLEGQFFIREVKGC